MGMAVSVPRYTVDDLDQFPNDGNRYELLDGFLLVTPAPRMAHQAVASRLQFALTLALKSQGQALVVGPGAVTVLPGTQLEPDVLVMPDHFAIDIPWWEVTEHWLAVEVLSRSSRVYDRTFKRAAYFGLGVGQVWLVDIDDQSVEVWHTRESHEVMRDVIHWRVPTRDLAVTIELAEIFAGLG